MIYPGKNKNAKSGLKNPGNHGFVFILLRLVF
jgi:hypothetical protein